MLLIREKHLFKRSGSPHLEGPEGGVGAFESFQEGTDVAQRA